MSVAQVEVSPLENAISVVENKNQELRTLISQYQHKQLHGNINLLSMTLNGVIDAAVNGGIARYQEVRQSYRNICLRSSHEAEKHLCDRKQQLPAGTVSFLVFVCVDI